MGTLMGLPLREKKLDRYHATILPDTNETNCCRYREQEFLCSITWQTAISYSMLKEVL